MNQVIWQGIVESERYYHYYYRLAEKLRKRQYLLDAIILVCTGGVVTTLILSLGQGPSETYALVLLSGLVAALVGWQQLKQYATKMTAAHLIAAQYKSLSMDWRRQWERGEDLDDESVVDTLRERLISIGGQYDLPFDERLRDEAEKASDEVVLGEFPTAA